MYDARQRRILYQMAHVVCERAPEIKNAESCRAVLRSAGFVDRVINEHLRTVQHMARVIRGQQIGRLVKKLMDQS